MIIYIPTGAPLITKESIFQSMIVHIREDEEVRLFMVIAVVKRLDELGIRVWYVTIQ